MRQASQHRRLGTTLVHTKQLQLAQLPSGAVPQCFRANRASIKPHPENPISLAMVFSASEPNC